MKFTVAEIKMFIEITITWVFWIIVHLIVLLSFLVSVRVFLGINIPKKLMELISN